MRPVGQQRHLRGIEPRSKINARTGPECYRMDALCFALICDLFVRCRDDTRPKKRPLRVNLSGFSPDFGLAYLFALSGFEILESCRTQLTCEREQ